MFKSLKNNFKKAVSVSGGMAALLRGICSDSENFGQGGNCRAL